MDKIVDSLWEQPVLVENGLCSRFRSSKSECTACADVCPVRGAVRVGEDGIAVTSACIACGACVSACPNGAIQAAEGDRGWADAVRGRVRPSVPFRISCDRAAGPADLVVPCLSRLTEALVLEPLRWGAERVEILAPDCSGCRLRKAAPQWERVLGFSAALCEAAGLEAGRVARGDKPRRKRDEEDDLPDSRRGMFRAVAKWSAAVAATPPAGPEQPPAEQFREAVKRHHKNPKRSHLLDVLRALPGTDVRPTVVPAAGQPLADVDVTSACMACGVCETLCPVGALRHHVADGVYALEFDPASCTGCGVCEAACFPKAIRVRETVELSVLFEPRPVTLIRATHRTCRVCSGPFLEKPTEAEESSGVCPMCRESLQRQERVAKRLIRRGSRHDRS